MVVQDALRCTKHVGTSMTSRPCYDEVWVSKPKAIHNLLADVFTTSVSLLPHVEHEYSIRYEYKGNKVISGFLPARSRWTLEVLKAMEFDSSDVLSTTIFKYCAKLFASFATMIAHKY